MPLINKNRSLGFDYFSIPDIVHIFVKEDYNKIGFYSIYNDNY